MATKKTRAKSQAGPAGRVPASRSNAGRPAPRPTGATPHKQGSGRSRSVWIGLTMVVMVIAAVAWGLSTRSANSSTAASGAAATNAAASSGARTAAAIPADEKKYIGRLLPNGYQEPTAQPVTYSGVTQMTDISTDPSGTQVSVSLADVTKNKIVGFTYTTKAGQSLPMLAYIKPSGSIWVGVSYCLPCKGTRQFVDADGTLTCGSCGTKRDLNTLAGISGACRLYPLDEVPASVAGGRLLVERGVLDAWSPQPQDRPVG